METARSWAHRSRWVGLVALVVLTGCGNEDNSQEVTPTLNTSAPTTDADGPSPDIGGGGGGVSVSLPSAPVGGQSTQPGDDPGFQCLSVNWLAGDDAAIPEGASVALGSFTFHPAVLDVADGGCESEGPNCTGFEFTSTDLSCFLPVRWDGTPFDPEIFTASANVDATASCDNDSSECAAFLEAVVNQAPAQLGVTLPPPEEPSPEDGTETTSEGGNETED